MASQFFATAKTQIPYLMDNIEVGKFKPLVDWLNNNIHACGSLYNSGQLLKKVTDSYLKLDY
jgi:Zn-dependent M32 family carboxypeptidase